MSVLLESAGEHAVITGDVFHTPLQIGLPERFASFDDDAERAIATRRSLIERVADDDVLVLGTHFPPPTAGRVRSGDHGHEFIG